MQCPCQPKVPRPTRSYISKEIGPNAQRAVMEKVSLLYDTGYFCEVIQATQQRTATAWDLILLPKEVMDLISSLVLSPLQLLQIH